jgi:hypothetical protein
MGVQATVPESEMNLSTFFPTAMHVATPIKETIVLLKFLKWVLFLEG